MPLRTSSCNAATAGALRAAHIVLLLGSLALLPIVPGAIGQGQADWGPAWQILLLLVLTIGLPFTLLAMTSPLLQAWIAGSKSRVNPYRLFAVSNLASLAALLAYPWLIEPWLRTATQAVAWSWAYAAYVLVLCAISLRRPRQLRQRRPTPGRRSRRRGWPRTLGWFALAALGSYQLVAVTNHLTQNIPSFPMMWVLPLVIYLLSFTLCFDADRWYPPRAYRAATLLALVAMCALLVQERQVKGIGWHIGTFLLGLFIVCMFCHGELARSRPGSVAADAFLPGGVGRRRVRRRAGRARRAGGVARLLRGRDRPGAAGGCRAVALLGARPPVGGAARWCCWVPPRRRCCACNDALTRSSHISRNFFGVLRVREYGRDDPQQLGACAHPRPGDARTAVPGAAAQAPADQLLRRGLGRRPLARVAGRSRDRGRRGGSGCRHYCHLWQGGRPLSLLRDRRGHRRGRARHFSFIADSAATVDVPVGDGRLLLQAEPPKRFDVLVVDAFSGDSIPVHLLTREAIMLYRERLKPGGVIALHISNSHLDLGAGGRPHRRRPGHASWRSVADAGIEGDPEHIRVGLDPAGRGPARAGPAAHPRSRDACRRRRTGPGPTITATSCRY